MADGPTPLHDGDWRNTIRVHAAAALFPMMSDTELDELAADIEKNGLLEPITWWVGDISNYRDEDREVIDGRNRVEATHRIKNPQRREELRAHLLSRLGSQIVDGDPVAYVISLNIRRRHLSPEQKRQLLETLVKDKPQRSDRATARIAQVDHKTVAAVRAEAERRGEIPHVATRTDTKGREQPASKPKSVNSNELETKTQPRQPVRDLAITDFSRLLRDRLLETLNDLPRLLADERHRIATLRLSTRVAIARGLLQALDVTLADLGGAPIERGTQP